MQDFLILLPNLNLMHTITLGNHQLTYQITYQKKRKTLQLKIVSNTHLEITAPNNFPKNRMEEVLYKKSPWIVKHLLQLETITQNPLNNKIIHGATILYLGKNYTLTFVNHEDSLPAITMHDNQILIHFPKGAHSSLLPSNLLREWYWSKAQDLLLKKTALWSRAINVQPQRITLKDQKTRWGSCSSKGNLNYNWRIIMAPPEVIDYLVIHELCHLRTLNHSSLFWQEVRKFSPNYKIHRTWLQTNGSLLMKIFPKT